MHWRCIDAIMGMSGMMETVLNILWSETEKPALLPHDVSGEFEPVVICPTINTLHNKKRSRGKSFNDI